MSNNFGGAAKADTRQTHDGQAPGTRPEHIAASLFFPKREPHSQLFGEKKNSLIFSIILFEPKPKVNQKPSVPCTFTNMATH